jgi:hypothetical protein
MSFTLRLFVMGLVAVVKGAEPGSLTLVLQNAANHIPILICDPYNCTLDPKHINQGPDIENLLNLESGDVTGYILEEEEITLKGVEQGSVRAVEEMWKPHWYDYWTGAVPANRNEAVSFGWIPYMKEVMSDAEFIEEDYLLKPWDYEVAGILPLKGLAASVSSFHLVEIDGSVCSLTFMKPPERLKMHSVKRALPDVLLIEIPVNQPNVTISLEEYGDASSTRSMQTQPEYGARSVDVLLGNITPCEMGGNTSPSIDHFNHYYDMSAVPISNGRRQFPRKGWKCVDANLVNPKEEPPVLDAVSCTGEFSADFKRHPKGGLSRPMCTFSSYELP